jgi:UDP-GlcNAc:undecaprenyl-phosphate/decaprenyl-phosphate GlcNAc-1-phosphate transferase
MPFVAALVGALLLTPLGGKLGSSLGVVDRPANELKIHRHPVPVLGGVVVVVITIAAASAIGPGYAVAVWLAVLLALAVGLIDDLRPTSPWARLVLLSGAGVLLVVGGLDLGPVGVLGGPATVLLVLACCNAVNVLDGQDGLAGGLGVIAALGLAGLSARNGDAAGTTLGLALAGALSGFLAYNVPPARIYLGNGGAYAVGVLLAALAASVVERGGWVGLIASGLCLGVYAFELLFTMLRRVSSRRPMVTGDRLHSYDRLARRIGRSRSTLVFWALGAVAAGLGLLADALGVTGAIVIGSSAFGVAAALGVWDLGRGEARLRRLR